MGKMCRSISLHEPKREWSMMETKATELIEDISRIEGELIKRHEFDYQARGHKKQPRLLFTLEEYWAYMFRAQAKKARGNLQGAIDDCTEAFAMMDLLGLPKNERDASCFCSSEEKLFMISIGRRRIQIISREQWRIFELVGRFCKLTKASGETIYEFEGIKNCREFVDTLCEKAALVVAGLVSSDLHGRSTRKHRERVGTGSVQREGLQMPRVQYG
jgi:hypothetical protein